MFPVIKSSSPKCLCLRHTSLEMYPLNPALSYRRSVAKQLSEEFESEIAWLQRHIHLSHSFTLLLIKYHEHSAQWWMAVVLLSVAYGCFKSPAVWIWNITNANRKASLVSRASALSSVKLLAKIHSEIMGAVRYGCLWRTCGVIQQTWWTGVVLHWPPSKESNG